MSIASVAEVKNVMIPHFWIPDERELEPYQKITWDAHGTTDVYGEWHYIGEDFADIPRGRIENVYEYHVELKRVRSKTGRSVTGYKIIVSLTRDFFDYQVGEAKTKSKRKARQMVVDIIRRFECSSRFATDVWPRVIAIENRSPIVKRMEDGSFQWIATTLSNSPFGVIDRHGQYSEWGHGEYWYQYHRRWKNDETSIKWARVTTKGYVTSGGYGDEVPSAVARALEIAEQ